MMDAAELNDLKVLMILVSRVQIKFGEDFEPGKLASRLQLSSKMSPLHKAVALDNIEIVLAMLKLRGIDIECKTLEEKRTPLHLACEKGFTALTNLLLKYRASANALDRKKNCPMCIAAASGHTGCVRALVDNGGSQNLRNVLGLTPLLAAIIHKRERCALLLIKMGSDMRSGDKHGNTGK